MTRFRRQYYNSSTDSTTIQKYYSKHRLCIIDLTGLLWLSLFVHQASFKTITSTWFCWMQICKSRLTTLALSKVSTNFFVLGFLLQSSSFRSVSWALWVVRLVRRWVTGSVGVSVLRCVGFRMCFGQTNINKRMYS